MNSKTICTPRGQTMIGGLLLFVLFATLAATFWPFNPYPRNEVTWLKDSNGLRFGDYSQILSSGEFSEAGSADPSSCSLEIWFQPLGTDDKNTILAFYTVPDLLKFTVRQDGSNLYILRDVPQDRANLRKAAIWIDRIFHKGDDLHIAITSGARGTAVYLNGAQVGSVFNLGLTLDNLTGHLIVGNSPLRNTSWSGVLRGLAIYSRELTASQVAAHHAQWVMQGGPEDDENNSAVALYRFDERTGNVVHNQAHRGPDLYIPEHYKLVQHGFLTMPWNEFHADWDYVQDVLVNIVGFVPLGLLLCAYLSLVRQSNRAVLQTIFVGGLISLTIETLQTFLPTRFSGLTDVITNTVGSGVGALLYGVKGTQDLLYKIGLLRAQENGVQAHEVLERSQV